MPFDVDARIADWRKSLLDTTKRNRLIKFAAGRTGGVNIVHPPAAALWTTLVRDSQPLSFPWKRELLGLPREVIDAETLASDIDPASGSSDSADVARELTALCLRSPNLRPTHILSDFTDRQLAARLIRLSRAAKEAEVDRGVTTLFAAFGFLRWFETGSTEEILSPLLLVPVRLSRQTLESPFTLESTEDEVLPNHCLVELLDNQYKIKFPTALECPLEADNADCYVNYLRAVSERINHAAHWSVIENSALGVFNFQKLAMWEDLGRNSSRIKAHALCRAVAGDPTAYRPSPQGMPAAAELDRLVRPHEAIHILDADSSQHEAIEAVKRGADVVLDGPPGTGKSQTIANIIAETLAAGKTVLFVSAKIAALEVVKRRLDGLGLGDFCLEIHSQKASKKEVAAELGRCLELAAEGRPETSSQLDELADSRRRLNEFVMELHAVRSPLSLSAFQVHGELARIESLQTKQQGVPKRSRVEIADPLAKDAEFVRRGGEILAGLGDCHAILDEPGGHPWRGCKITTFAHSLHDDAAHSLKQFAGVVPAAQSAVEALGEAGFIEVPATVPGWRSAANNAGCVLAAPIFPPEWFRTDPRSTAEAWIELDNSSREARASKSRLTEFDHDAVRSLKEPADVALPTGRDRLALSSVLSARQRLAALSRVQKTLLELQEKIKAIDILGRSVAQQLKLGIVPAFQELGKLAEIAGRLPQAIPLSWWEEHRRAELAAVAARAEDAERSALAQRPSLAARLAPAALEPEACPAVREAAQAASSFWRWLPWSRWHQVRKSIEDWYPTGAAPGATIRADIAELALYHRRMDSARQVAAAYEKELIFAEEGKANWQATTAGLADIEQLLKWKSAADLKTLAGPGGKLDRRELQTSAEKLVRELKAFEALWLALGQDLAANETQDQLRKTSAELAGWLEGEAASIAAECGVLNVIVGLLRADHDLDAAALTNRAGHLHKLVLARKRIAAALEKIRNTSSPQELEAIDHTEQAAKARTLLQVLADLTCPLKAGVVSALTDTTAKKRLEGLVRQSLAAWQEFEKPWQRITTDLFDADHCLSNSKTLNTLPLGELKTWAEARLADIDRLQEWTRFVQVEKDVAAFGLTGIMEEVKSGEYGPTEAAEAFRARFYRLWLDALHQKVPALGSFTTSSHERLIARFAELDRLAIRSAPERVRADLLGVPERPQMREHAPETSELGILLREVHKKQRHIPLRRLFAQIPWVLPRLKPCLMMSPLAVSTFLDSPELTFDLVIFDEASQVRPHDAVCAIYRGRQMVVGGDPKQLPPTDFFNRGDDVEEDAESGAGNLDSFESLLDICLSRGLLRKWLRWHYRSRRESLIAFSNRHFYENRLITFPSAEEAAGSAIAFIRVADGCFKDGINAVEAKRAATLILEHARNSPALSLGVIAFSQRQQDRILDELELLRRQEPALESFFADNGPEPFFVKNLENVQGDERDVVLLSVGYGPDESGKVALRFGPLNQQGGERRLNVAITRARRAMTVVSSMTAADIDTRRASSEGARLLRAFLEYAEKGPTALGSAGDQAGTEGDSVLEREIAMALRARGLTVHRQIGCGGYKIDLAIADSQSGGKYLLGVECDGANYHSAATARDRDRLRQAILAGLGWRLVRVWSSDWVRDRDKQVQRILAALKDTEQKDKKPRSLEYKKSPPVRKPAFKPVDYEEIEAVPDAAVTEAILASLAAFGSMPAEELAAAVSKQLGFKRTGPKIRDRAIASVNNLLAEGQLALTGENRVRLVPAVRMKN